jgi:methyl-accepting chemotaxis protein
VKPSAQAPRLQRPRFRSLVTKIVVLSAGISFVLALGLTIIGYRKASSGLEERTRSALSAESLLTASLIDAWASERIEGLKGLAGLRTARRLLETAASPAVEDIDAANASLADVAAAEQDVESIALFDRNGRVLASSNQDDDGKNFAGRAYVREALAGRIFAGGVLASPASKRMVFFGVPVRGSNGAIVGSVGSRASIQHVRDLVADVRRAGSGAQGLLLDEGNALVATNADPAWLLRVPAEMGGSGASQPIPQAELSGLGAAVGAGPVLWNGHGTPYLGVAQPLRRLRWTYLAALPVAEVRRAAREFLRTGALAAGVGVLLAFVLSSLQARRLVRSLLRLAEVSGRVVSEGDLTQTIGVESDDEVGVLAQSFGRMVQALREALHGLRQSADTLREASDDLGRTTKEQEEFLSHQAAALQETQVTAQEIKQTSLLAAQKAERVLEVAQRAELVGRNGEAAADSGVRGLSAIRTEAGEMGDRIQQLSERARQIGGITMTVKDLADQSNMLALNAAIEAVRSGEHGRGFSVVAREIRSLADQSIRATARVNEILTELTQSIAGAVQMASRSADKMAGGLQEVRATGDNLRELSLITKENVDAVRQISAAVSQQNAGIGQIFSAVTEQMKLMEETRARLEKTGAASMALREVANGLFGTLARYRL